MIFTSFISHDDNNSVRSGSLRVEDTEGDEVLSEHRELLQGVALEKIFENHVVLIWVKIWPIQAMFIGHLGAGVVNPNFLCILRAGVPGPERGHYNNNSKLQHSPLQSPGSDFTLKERSITCN